MIEHLGEYRAMIDATDHDPPLRRLRDPAGDGELELERRMALEDRAHGFKGYFDAALSENPTAYVLTWEDPNEDPYETGLTTYILGVYSTEELAMRQARKRADEVSKGMSLDGYEARPFEMDAESKPRPR